MLNIDKTGGHRSIAKAILLALSLGTFAFVFVPYIIMASASAEEININVMVSDYYLSLDTGTGPDDEGGNVNFGSVNVDEDGSLVMARKDITVDTTAKYYMVYLSSTSTDTSLTNNNASGAIGATPGTFSAPVAFSTTANPATDNSWGYAITKHPEDTRHPDGLTPAPNFSSMETYFISNTGTETGYKTFSAKDEASDSHWGSKWAGLSVKSEPQKIFYDNTDKAAGFSGNTPTEDGVSRDWVIPCRPENSTICNSEGPAKFSVYYGAKINNSLLMGEYKNTVLYTAIASLQDIADDKAETAYMSTNATGGDSDIKLTLSMSTVPKLEKDDVKVYLVDHDTYNAEIGNYGSIQILDTTLAQKGATCSVTNVSVEYSTKSAVIDCTLPPLGTTFAGSKTIKLADDVADKSTQRNTYDFIVSVPNYNLKFTTRYNDAQPGLAYVGLQTKDLNGKYYVTKMQEMTPGICANTTSYKKGNWGISSSGYYVDSATTSFGPDDAFYGTLNPTNNKYYKTIASNYGEPVGNKATSVDALTDDEYELLLKGTLTGKDDVVSVWNGLTAGQKWEYNLYRKHQWTLKDTRNGYDYVIRKLADDNCWMVQNLDLELTTLTTFTDADTDINTYRNPDGSEFAGVPTGAQIESGLASKSWTPSSLSDTWKSSHAITDSAEKATRGDYIITQYENKNEHDWAWDDNGEDGTHAYRQSAAGNNIEDKPKFYDPDDFKSTTPAPYIQCMDGLKLVSNCTETNVDRYTVRYPNVKLTETNGGVARGSADTRLAGMYYNWYAATAGTGTATTGSGVNVSDSICPKGWQLPSYDGNKSYVNLTRDTYGKYKIGTYVYEGDYNYNSYPAYDGLDILPLSFLRSGYYGWSNGARNNRGSYGYCWGSRAASGTDAYGLYFDLVYFSPQSSSRKGRGFSVRCVAR